MSICSSWLSDALQRSSRGHVRLRVSLSLAGAEKEAQMAGPGILSSQASVGACHPQAAESSAALLPDPCNLSDHRVYEEWDVPPSDCALAVVRV